MKKPRKRSDPRPARRENRDGVQCVIIPLTRGFEAIIDEESYTELVSNYRWFAYGTNHVYAARNGTRRAGVRHKPIFLHRELLSKSGLITDHINRNTMDNRMSNLRLATKAQNNANSKKKKSKDGLRGVYRAGRLWKAQITLDGKSKLLGLFTTMEDAAMCYDTAATKRHGEFAVTNKTLGLI